MTDGDEIGRKFPLLGHPNFVRDVLPSTNWIVEEQLRLEFPDYQSARLFELRTSAISDDPADLFCRGLDARFPEVVKRALDLEQLDFEDIREQFYRSSGWPLNQPNASAKEKIWSRYDVWTTGQCLALQHGYEPDYFQYAIDCDVVGRFKADMRASADILRSAEESGVFKRYEPASRSDPISREGWICPSAFVAWAEEKHDPDQPTRFPINEALFSAVKEFAESRHEGVKQGDFELAVQRRHMEQLQTRVAELELEIGSLRTFKERARNNRSLGTTERENLQSIVAVMAAHAGYRPGADGKSNTRGWLSNMKEALAKFKIRIGKETISGHARAGAELLNPSGYTGLKHPDRDYIAQLYSE